MTQAQNLANVLSFAFKTGTGIPYSHLNFPRRGANRTYYVSPRNDNSNIAEVGTLILEWTRLADLTGNNTYYQLASKAESYLLNPQPPAQQIYPGLIGSEINVTTGQIFGGHVSWSGGADSFYEYLIKMFVYDPDRFQLYRDRWILAADSTIKNLAYENKSLNTTFLGELHKTYNDGTKWVESNTPVFSYVGSHLSCFDGGNFILGGTVLDRQDYIDFGKKLTDGCYKTYSRTATGIGPERFYFLPNGAPAEQKEFFTKHGFYLSKDQGSGYYLRPEVMESVYHAYRATGNKMYQDWSWNAFTAIRSKCKREFGYGFIPNVNDPEAKFDPRVEMYQESFFFAETLKYLYIIHAPVSPSTHTFDRSTNVMYRRRSGKLVDQEPQTRSRNGFLIRKLIQLELEARRFVDVRP